MTDSVCIVDDDPEIRALLDQYLTQNGFMVFAAENGDEMDKVLARESIDIVLLDVMMPGRDGVELCRTIRANSWLPVIMVTAKDSDIDRILGIEVGADDYLTKPFNPRELLARIKSVLRRARAPQAGPSGQVAKIDATAAQRGTGFDIAGRYLDVDSCVLYSASGDIIDVTAAEFDLLHALALSAGRAVTRAHLLSMTHGPVSEAYERSIDVLVSRVRGKLGGGEDEGVLIRTVRGVGYMLTAAVTSHKAT